MIGDFAFIMHLSMETRHMMLITMSEFDEFNKAFGRFKQSLVLLISLETVDKPNASAIELRIG